MAHTEETLKVDLALLKELSNKRTANEASKKIVAIIGSLHDRQEFAHYHYHTFKKIISKVDTDLAKLEMALHLSDDNIRKKFAIKASISACIQSIHITHDILAYLITTILNLDLSENKITFYNVKEKLNNYKNLKKLLVDFSSHDDYKYLTSYVNHTKHRFHVEPKVTYHFTGNKHYSAQFERFSFKNKEYSEQDVDKFINREYNREAKLIIMIENELISILESNEIVQ